MCVKYWSRFIVGLSWLTWVPGVIFGDSFFNLEQSIESHNFTKMRKVSLPDRKAPRFCVKAKSTGTRSQHKKFLEKYPEYSHLTYKEFLQIYHTFNTEIRNSSITVREGVELPSRLGVIYIVSVKPVTVAINYALTHKLGKTIIYNNLHTDGLRSSIAYTVSDNRYKYAFCDLWAFHPKRPFKHQVSKEYPKNYQMYMRCDSKTKYTDILERTKAKDAMLLTDKKKLETYNEFEL